MARLWLTEREARPRAAVSIQPSFTQSDQTLAE